MGGGGYSALKTAGPVPFDLATMSGLRDSCVPILGPINPEHVPALTAIAGKGTVLGPCMSLSLIDKIDQGGAYG